MAVPLLTQCYSCVAHGHGAWDWGSRCLGSQVLPVLRDRTGGPVQLPLEAVVETYKEWRGLSRTGYSRNGPVVGALSVVHMEQNWMAAAVLKNYDDYAGSGMVSG